MRIDEIVVYPNRIENIEKYNQYFKNASGAPAFGDLTAYRHTGSDEDYFGLFNGTRLISILHLNVREHGQWQISYAQTEPEYQGQGCFRYLLNLAITAHGSVLSDSHQTTASKDAWQSLIKYPGPSLDIFVYDTETKNQIPARDVPENQIWNNKDTPVLLATLQPVDVKDRDRVMTRLKESNGIDRTISGIWYGPHSSTDDYKNP